MKVKWGALIVDGRGKVGGHVACKNRAGAYLRTKVTPVNPNTTFQAGVRNRLATLAQGWRNLTFLQITAWNASVLDFSKTDVFGDIKNPSGFNLYMRLNANLLSVGEAVIADPPTPAEVATVILQGATFDIGAGDETSLTLSGNVPATSDLQVWGTAGQSPGKTFVKSEYRLLNTYDGGEMTPIDVQTSYTLKFGVPSAGEKVFFKIVFINNTTGQASSEQSVSVIVEETA